MCNFYWYNNCPCENKFDRGQNNDYCHKKGDWDRCDCDFNCNKYDRCDDKHDNNNSCNRAQCCRRRCCFCDLLDCLRCCCNRRNNKF